MGTLGAYSGYSWCLQWASFRNAGGNDVGGGDVVVVVGGGGGGGVCVCVCVFLCMYMQVCV